MPWTLCTSGSAVAKAGANASTTVTLSGSILVNWSNEAESYACALCRYDVVTNFSELTTEGKEVLQQLVTARIAQKIITYDMTNYNSRYEAETMLDILENEFNDAKALLNDDKNRKYLGINSGT